MMDKIFTKQKAPLFNRATAKIILPPLKPTTVWKIQADLKNTRPEKQIETYCIFGGVPYYYEILENQQSDVIDSLFFGVGQLHEEGQDILRQEFGSKYKKYFSILEAIGNGLVSTGEIANNIGLRQTTLSKYIQSLQNDFKLIERVVPFDQNPYRSKKGVYFVKDNLLAFWFSHVYGKTQAPTKNQLNTFFGKRFEFLCLEFLADWLSKKGERILKAGRWWGTIELEKGKFEQREIDLIVETENNLYIGECKWSNNPIGEKEVFRLKQSAKALKTKKIVKWVLFNKKGFSIRRTKEIILFDAKLIRDES
jgi:AAA+ ATPase superfamily predicted ATPase